MGFVFMLGEAINKSLSSSLSVSTFLPFVMLQEEDVYAQHSYVFFWATTQERYCNEKKSEKITYKDIKAHALNFCSVSLKMPKSDIPAHSLS